MKILAISDWHAKENVLPDLAKAIRDLSLEAVVFTGDILKWKAKCSEWANARTENRPPNKNKPEIIEEIENNAQLYHTFYDNMRKIDLPFFTVPGNVDSPLRQYYMIALEQMERYPKLRVVHGSLSGLKGRFAVLGFGGEITEDEGEDHFVLQYRRRDVEPHFGMLAILSSKILLFHTPPIGSLDLDDGKHKGSKVVIDLIERCKPHWVFCGHAHGARGKEIIGDTIVVNPGALKNGFYALVDTDKKTVELKTL